MYEICKSMHVSKKNLSQLVICIALISHSFSFYLAKVEGTFSVSVHNVPFFHVLLVILRNMNVLIAPYFLCLSSYLSCC